MFTIRSKAYDGRYIEAALEQLPNVEGNCSEIRWTVTVAGGNDSYYSTGPITLTIGGQQAYYCKRKSYTTKVFPAARGSVSGSLTVPHDEDGGCTLEVRLESAIFTQTLSEEVDTWQLESIHRASGIRAADANIGSCSTVVINRHSSSFTHEIGYRFGQLSGWLDASGDPVEAPVRHSETTINFLLPEAFYWQIPDRPRDNCLLTCITYYGDTEIGRTQCSFAATADPAVCMPVVTGSVTPMDDLTLILTDGVLIPGISTACCQVQAVAQKGAQVTALTAGGVPVEDGQALLEGWALDFVPVVAVDSRGYEARVSLPSPCLPYVQLTNLAEAERPEPTADRAVLTLWGKCFVGSFGAAENALAATVEFDGRQLQLPLTPEADGSYRQELVLEDLSYTRSYPVSVTVADRAMAVTRQLTVRKGLPVFDWGEGDFRFHVPVELPELTIGGLPLASYIQSVMKN